MLSAFGVWPLLGNGLIWAVANVQHSQRFNRLPLIGPCVHTIRNQDLMVPFEGFEDGADGTFQMQRGRPWGGATSFFTG